MPNFYILLITFSLSTTLLLWQIIYNEQHKQQRLINAALSNELLELDIVDEYGVLCWYSKLHTYVPYTQRHRHPIEQKRIEKKIVERSNDSRVFEKQIKIGTERTSQRCVGTMLTQFDVIAVRNLLNV